MTFNESISVSGKLSKVRIKEVVATFADAAKRALKASIDVIEIHNVHEFLWFSFLSPHSNKRTEAYGGDFENHIHSTLEVVRTFGRHALVPQVRDLLLVH